MNCFTYIPIIEFHQNKSTFLNFSFVFNFEFEFDQCLFDEFHSFPFLIASDQLVETLKTSPVYDPFTKSSFFWTFLSIILSLSDYGSDIAVAVLLYGEEDTGKSLSEALIFASIT